MHNKKLISFVIPTFQRRDLLKKCLNSLHFALSELRPQDLREFKFEARVIFNGEALSSLEQEEFLHGAMEIRLLFCEKVKPSEARNLAIRNSSSDYFYFIDDDTVLPSDHLLKLCEIIRNYSDADVFGGPDSCNIDAGLCEKSLELALRSPLTTSKTRKRHSPKSLKRFEKGHETNLILCNLCVKGLVFQNLGIYFPENYGRNEENVFLNCLEGKASILYFPHLFIFHKRRTGLSKVFRSAAFSGFYRLRMIAEGKSQDKILFIVPGFFVLYLIILIGSIHWFRINSFIFIPFYLYWILNFLTTLKVVLESRRPLYFPITSFYQFFIVISYGLGILSGLKGIFSFPKGYCYTSLQKLLKKFQ